MLVRREALERAGGIAAIRHEIIDDCALAALMKRQGPIWLGLTERARSLRPYGSLGAIGRMISRSAYAQLGYSPLMLAGTVIGLALVYLAAPLLVITAHGLPMALGLFAWVAMLVAFQRMLRFYGLSPLVGRGAAGDRRPLSRLHRPLGRRCLARKGRPVEGPRPGRRGRRRVTELSSGKGAKDENFPVASILIAPRHREVVMRFYAVARLADDIADHPDRLSRGEAEPAQRDRGHP